MWDLLPPPYPLLSLSPTVVLSVGLAITIFFVLSRFCAQGRLSPLGLLVALKGSLQSEKTASVL